MFAQNKEQEINANEKNTFDQNQIEHLIAPIKPRNRKPLNIY